MHVARRGFLLVLLMGLAACGGGGSSGSGGGGGGSGGGGGGPTYTMTGSVTGLAGSGFIVRVNSTDVAISANGTVTLVSGLANGATYTVTVVTQPSTPAQVCTLTNASGTVSGGNVTNIAIACTTTPLSLTSSTPALGSADALRTVAPVLTFSAPLDAATAVPDNVSLQSAAGSQPVTLNVSGRDLIVTPSKMLLPLAAYTITVGTGLRGSDGESLAGSVTVTFTTVDGQWQTNAPLPTMPPDATSRALHPQIAFDSNGDALAVWEHSDGTTVSIASSRYVSGSGWGAPELIETETGDAIRPQIAIDASGNALSVWTQFDGTWRSVVSNRYTAGNGWGTAEAIETEGGDADEPQITIDPAGNAVAVWTQIDGVAFVLSNRFTVGSGWSASRLIASDDSGDSDDPEVAIDPSGNALVVWEQSDGQRHNIRASGAAPGADWGTPVHLEARDGEVFPPQLAIDSSGNALAVWSQYDGARFSIWSNRYTAGIGWGTATLIEADDAGDGFPPQIAIDANGNALAIWPRYGGTRDELWSNRYTAGSWGTAAPIDLGPDSGSVFSPHIAFDPSGNALAVWRESKGAAAIRVRASRYTAGNGWSTGSVISSNEVDVLVPKIATDTNGNALAIWTRVSRDPQSGNSRYSTWFSRFE